MPSSTIVDKIVVKKSTVPVHMVEAVRRVLKCNKKGLKFQVLSNPGFLAEGMAIPNLKELDHVLIGGVQSPKGLSAAKMLASVYHNWVPQEQILLTSLWLSELVKLVANVFLVQRVLSNNSILAMCKATGVNISEITRAVGMDGRIGKQFLNFSIGFGGSCFQKDILNLVYLCKTYGLRKFTEYWNQVIVMNDYQKKY
jgi:UDPglucose 6-dehydrogenase